MGDWFLYNFAAESFNIHIKNVCSRLLSMSVLVFKTAKLRFEPPFWETWVGLNSRNVGYIRVLSLAR